MEWQPIETAPKEDNVSFLVLIPCEIGHTVAQVSRFEGQMYPDAMDCNICWDDRITNAAFWMPCPNLPKNLPRKLNGRD